MRTFKFRAYEDDKMYYQVRCGGVFDDIPTAPTVWDEKQGDWLNLTGQPHTLIMQFTGLKDKNGKEIYEGDIVIRSVYQTTKRENNDGSSSTLIHTNKPKTQTMGIVKYSEKDVGFETGNPSIWLGHYDDIEVIGNIYENPDLINK